MKSTYLLEFERTGKQKVHCFYEINVKKLESVLKCNKCAQQHIVRNNVMIRKKPQWRQMTYECNSSNLQLNGNWWFKVTEKKFMANMLHVV